MVGKRSKEDSRYRRFWATVRRFHIWQLVAILIPMIFLSATLLRLNNLNMVERRDAVLKADEELNRNAAHEGLVDLQRYISSHMNTSLANGITLENIYNHDYEKALSKSDTSNPNSAIYQQASIECRSRFQGGVDSFRNDYVQCVVQRVSALSASEGAADASLPKAGQYHYDFASPVWSLDLAGLSVAITLLIAIYTIWKISKLLVVKLVLNRRLKKFYY